jgi:hypothetical protein
VRGEKGGGKVQRLSPADPAVFIASDGRYGAWRWERPWISSRPSSLGPRFSRLCPNSNGEAVVSLPSWNKSFRSRPHLGGTSSGAGERSVKVGSPGSGTLVEVSVLGGSCTGVCGRPTSRALRLAATATCFCTTGGAAVGVEMVRLMDLGVLAVASSDPRPWRHGVCPRPMDLNGDVILVFSDGILLRLIQSFQAIVLPSVSGCWLLLAGSSVFHGSGLQQQWSPACQANRWCPKDFFVISFSSRGSSVSLVGTAVLCTCCVCVPVCAVYCTF